MIRAASDLTRGFEPSWAAYRPDRPERSDDELEPCVPDDAPEETELVRARRHVRPPLAVIALLVASGAFILAAGAFAVAAGGLARHPVAAVTPTAESAWPLYAEIEPGSGPSFRPSAAAWADQPTAAWYQPRYGADYSSPTAGVEAVDATVRRSGTGRYTVIFRGLGAPAGTARADAYSSAATCDAVGWAALGVDEHVDVVCAAGPRPTDSPFDVAFTA